MGSKGYRISLQAGRHKRRSCPMTLSLPENLDEKAWELRTADDSPLPLQVLPNGTGVFMLPSLPAGATLDLTLLPREDKEGASPPRVAILDDSQAISITVDGNSLTTYHYSDVPARPYFYPLLTSEGLEVTRAFPMRADVAGESKDHPHHRSLWIAHGDVNGIDNWSEETGHGSTRHDAVLTASSGDVCGQFTTTGTWMAPSGQSLLTQRLEVTAWATPPEFRLLDFTIDLTAEQDSVLFGDTKEGGILSVRIVGTMDVPRGGQIENSYGGLDEVETWGKSAHWCDYSGPVAETIQGLAVMDHPLSFRYPTHWHVRNYGLMTANPFGYAAYTGGVKHGEHRLAKGETLLFRYRLVIHTGDAGTADIRSRYLDFVSPPRATITPLE